MALLNCPTSVERIGHNVTGHLCQHRFNAFAACYSPPILSKCLLATNAMLSSMQFIVFGALLQYTLLLCYRVQDIKRPDSSIHHGHFHGDDLFQRDQREITNDTSIDEKHINRHFAPNPLDNIEHFPASELGMLGEPLKVETARMCDPQKQALLEPKWFWCPDDPTCRKCARSWDRNVNVTEAFRDPAHVKARKDLYRTAFKNVPYNTVTVQAVNHGQVHLWLNWVCSCEAHGFNVRESTILVPADPEAEKVIVGAGFRSVGLDWQDQLSHGIHADYNGRAGSTQQHSDINNILMLTTAEVLSHGHHVLMVDVDIAWIRDPRVWLSNDALSADVLAMVAARWDAQGTANTGMVFLRSNRRTQLLMESIVNLFPIKGWSDQVLFNMVLRHYQMRQVSFHNLPTRLFPVLPGQKKDILKKSWRDEAYTVHAVGSHKEQRLDEAGLMYYNSSCSIFAKQLKPWVTLATDSRKGS